MKKVLSLILFLAVTSLACVACANVTEANIGRQLDINLTKLQSVVKKLDTIDNNYISNPDIYSGSVTASNFENDVKSYRIASNNSVVDNLLNSITNGNSINKSDANSLLQEILYNKITEKLTQDNNGNCKICGQNYSCNNDGFCNNCGNKIMCDQQGCCTNCNSHLNLTNQNTCSSCNANAVISKSTCSKIINALNDENLSAEQLSTTNSNFIDNGDSNKELITPKHIPTETYENKVPEAMPKTFNNFEEQKEDFTPRKISTYNYDNQSFAPDKLKYNPRYYSTLDETTVSDQISNYIYKVQKLYAMTSDAVEANTLLHECRDNLLNCIYETKDLNKCITNGTCTPSQTQLQALSNYINDIKNTITRLKNCNGDLNDQINSINGTNNSTFATGIDVINSNYLTLINNIDTRISYHESAIATLEQIKYILEDMSSGDTSSEEDLQNYLDQLDNTQSNIESSDTIEDTTTNSNEETIDNTNSSTNENVETTTETDIENKQNQVVENSNTTNNQQVDNTTNSVTDSNISETNENVVDTDNSNKTGIVPNIDTYKPNNNTTTTTQNNDETSIENNDELNNENNSSLSNEENNADINNNQNITSSNADSNALGYGNANVNGGILNNNGYQNGIVNENNLNTSENNLGYYYGADGKIYNNGTNNGTIGNNGNTIENNLNSNNNVNTYGYNTLLDIINQGTVNNGINTLHIA